MAWLLRDGEVLACVERTRGRRLRNPMPPDLEGALIVDSSHTVHTVGAEAHDVAYCRAVEPGDGNDASYVVVEVLALAAWRIARPRLRASSVIEARWGSFDRWRLRPGDRLDVR